MLHEYKNLDLHTRQYTAKVFVCFQNDCGHSVHSESYPIICTMNKTYIFLFSGRLLMEPISAEAKISKCCQNMRHCSTCVISN